jgi:hypothetical protein
MKASLRTYLLACTYAASLLPSVGSREELLRAYYVLPNHCYADDDGVLLFVHWKMRLTLPGAHSFKPLNRMPVLCRCCCDVGDGSGAVA